MVVNLCRAGVSSLVTLFCLLIAVGIRYYTQPKAEDEDEGGPSTQRAADRKGRKGCCGAPSTPRPCLVLVCDLIKVFFGIATSLCVLFTFEVARPSPHIWFNLLSFVIIVIVPIPFGVLLWRAVVRTVTSKIANGVGRQTLLEALQASGRYNPNLRLRLDDSDCLDFRVEEEGLNDGLEGGGILGLHSVLPRSSWCAVQTGVWSLISLCLSLFVAGIIYFWTTVLKHIDWQLWLTDVFYEWFPIPCHGDSAPPWLLLLSTHILLCFLSTMLVDSQHRYHGRTVHRALSNAEAEDTANAEETERLREETS